MSQRGTKINWLKIGNYYSAALLPPKIYNLHFKFILQRKFLCTWQLEEHQDVGCRLGCGCKRETVDHWGSCPVLTETRRKLAEITGEPRFTTPTTFLIGETLAGTLDTGAANLWLVLWHTLMLAMINKTADNKNIDLDNVWNLSIRKFADLAMSAAYKAETRRLHCLAKGMKTPEDYPSADRILAPLATMSSDAHIRWSTKFRAELRRLDMPGYLVHDKAQTQKGLDKIEFVRAQLPQKEN